MKIKKNMHVKYSTKLKLNDRSMEIYRRSPAAEIVDIQYLASGGKTRMGLHLKYTQRWNTWLYITNESKHENYNMRSRKMHCITISSAIYINMYDIFFILSLTLVNWDTDCFGDWGRRSCNIPFFYCLIIFLFTAIDELIKEVEKLRFV